MLKQHKEPDNPDRVNPKHNPEQQPGNKHNKRQHGRFEQKADEHKLVAVDRAAEDKLAKEAAGRSAGPRIQPHEGPVVVHVDSDTKSD